MSICDPVPSSLARAIRVRMRNWVEFTETIEDMRFRTKVYCNDGKDIRGNLTKGRAFSLAKMSASA